MATILLFTLGTGNYAETTYIHGDQRVTTRFAAIAMRDFARAHGGLDRAISWVTPEARTANLAALQAAWGGDPCPLEARDLPTPRGDAEFWDLFDGLAGAVADGDHVLLDVTHGFRAMPLVAMLAIAYLRAVRRDVTIGMVGYGQHTPGALETPYLDLAPLVSLLDWTHGVQRLREGGDARPLAALLKGGHKGAFLQAQAEGWARPSLNKVGGTLEKLALALQTLRFDEVAKTAEALEAQLGALGPADHAGARPFMEIVPALVAEVAPLAESSGDQPLTDMARHQRTLLWLYERGLYFPYLSLLYESLIAHVAEVIGVNRLAGDDTLKLKEAHHYASIILTGARKVNGAEREVRPWDAKSPFHQEVLAPLDQRALRDRWRASQAYEQVEVFAEQVNHLRNALMHAGFSVSEAPAEGGAVVRKLVEFHQKAMALPIWGS